MWVDNLKWNNWPETHIMHILRSWDTFEYSAWWKTFLKLCISSCWAMNFVWGLGEECIWKLDCKTRSSGLDKEGIKLATELDSMTSNPWWRQVSGFLGLSGLYWIPLSAFYQQLYRQDFHYFLNVCTGLLYFSC